MKNKSSNTIYVSPPNKYYYHNHPYNNKGKNHNKNIASNGYHKNYYYTENFNTEPSYTYYGKKQWHNNNYNRRPYDKEKALTSLTTSSSKSFSQEKMKEEILNIKIKLKNEVKEITLYKNDDIASVVKTFIAETGLDPSLEKPLMNKLSRSIDVVNRFLDKPNDIEMFKKIKEMYDKK